LEKAYVYQGMTCLTIAWVFIGNVFIFAIFKEKHLNMDILSDPAVIWFLVGLGLLLLELVLPGLVILFFGAGAWVTALVCAITDVKLNVQILIFLVASLLGLILLRKYLKNRFFSRKDVETQDQLEEFIGHRAKAVIDFQDGLGKVEFKGTRWTARSTDDISKGQWVTIVSKDSLTLIVKSQKSKVKSQK
jgi:membrane protein implicated in regulation of membrane protease activity